MNECEKYIELISSAIDGEISDADRAALYRHLMTCPDCVKVMGAFSAISGNFPREEEPPEGFAAGTMAKIKAEAAKPTGLKKFISGYGKYTGLAAALVVVLLGARAFMGLGNGGASDSAAMANTSTSAESNMAQADVAVVGAESDDVAYDYAAGGSPSYSMTHDEAEAEEQKNSDGAPETGESSKASPPSSPAAGGSTFMESMTAITDVNALYALRGYSERFYSVSTAYAPIPDSLKELLESDGVSTVYSDLHGQHHKVPKSLLDEFDPDGVFTEIVFDDLTAEYGLVIVIEQEEN